MNSNENLSNLYSILYKEEGWLNKRTVLRNKLEAIQKLGFYGDPQSIHVLVRFLNHSSSEHRSAAIKSIGNLFKKLDTKKAYESSLRHCNITESDIRQYLRNYSQDEIIYPLAIASLNSSGYIREEALRKIHDLKLSSSLLPFVLYRLGDWVPEVRNAAMVNYLKVLTNENWEIIIEHLDLIFWLQTVQRVNLSKSYNRIIDYLLKGNESKTLSRFSELKEKNRFELAKAILKQESISQDAIQILLKDKSYLVRSKLAESINLIEEPQPIIKILERDKSSTVRQKCLESRIKIESEFQKIDFNKLLNDKSATIRNLARFHFKDSNIDFLKHYLSNLVNDKYVEPSIYGVGEVGDKVNIAQLIPYLDSSNTKLKKAAIRTVLKLDNLAINERLVKELDSKTLSIRKLAINQLSTSPNEKVLKKCRLIYSTGSLPLKLSMLSFFGHNCSHKTLPDLLEAVSDKDEVISNAAWVHLANWKRKSISNYSSPSKGEKEKARIIYGRTKFKNELSYKKQKLWDELPYFGRFDK